MSLDKQATAGSSFEIPTEDNHKGALVAIIDLGTHLETYKDGKTGESHKVYLIFEIDEKKADGANHVIGKEFTLTTGPKSGLRQMMEQWRGKKYNEGEEIAITKALGQPCMVNVTHGASAKGSEYAKLGAITKIHKEMGAFKPTYPLTLWEIGSDKPFPDHKWLPNSFLKGMLSPLKTVVLASKEMRPAQSNGTTTSQDTVNVPPPSMAEEEIPF